MKVKILLFAQLREIFGAAEKEFTLEDGTTIGELGSRLLTEAKLELPFLYAINEAYVKEDYELNEGDEVAFITPIAGG